MNHKKIMAVGFIMIAILSFQVAGQFVFAQVEPLPTSNSVLPTGPGVVSPSPTFSDPVLPETEYTQASEVEPIKLESKEDVEDLFWSLFDLLWTVFWVIAVVFIFYAAYLYMFGGASPENVKRANDTLKYAVIAIVIALVSKSLPNLIGNILR